MKNTGLRPEPGQKGVAARPPSRLERDRGGWTPTPRRGRRAGRKCRGFSPCNAWERLGTPGNTPSFFPSIENAHRTVTRDEPEVLAHGQEPRSRLPRCARIGPAQGRLFARVCPHRTACLPGYGWIRTLMAAYGHINIFHGARLFRRAPGAVFNLEFGTLWKTFLPRFGSCVVSATYSFFSRLFTHFSLVFHAQVPWFSWVAQKGGVLFFRLEMNNKETMKRRGNEGPDIPVPQGGRIELQTKQRRPRLAMILELRFVNSGSS